MCINKSIYIRASQSNKTHARQAIIYTPQTMQKPFQRAPPNIHSNSFTIHINEPFNHHHYLNRHHNHNNKISFIGLSSSMKLFSKFRKMFMRIVFTLPSSSSATVRPHKTADSSNNGCERLETPKISCSNSYYSSHSHYSEAISDCIDFFNKSQQESEDRIVRNHDGYYV